MFGRDLDLAAVRSALATSRVVTILGAGGLGKTTLALEVARTATTPVVHVVPLGSVVDRAGLIRTLTVSLGVEASLAGLDEHALTSRAAAERVATALAGPATLLVLDNCEQLVGAVADLVGQLVACVPKLTVLATSRRPLQVAPERIVALEGLRTGDGVSMFVDRANAIRPGVDVPTATAAEIVKRLDGMPLAIELAAAQVRSHSVGEIAAALDTRFELLQGGSRDALDRHRTLRAAIEWSWRMLDPASQRALNRLSVLRHPFGREAARHVLADLTMADEAVRDLVDHSLLTVVDVAGHARFRMLETIREFSVEQLATEDSATATAGVRDWALETVGAARPALGTGAEVGAIVRLLPEMPELAEVLRRAVAVEDTTTVAALGPVLGEVWLRRGELSDLSILVAAGRFAATEPLSWEWPPDTARDILALALFSESFLSGRAIPDVHARLSVLGPGADPQVAATVRVALTTLGSNSIPRIDRLLNLTRTGDRATAHLAWHWLAFALENQGDLAGALTAAGRALELMPTDPPPTTIATMSSVQARLLVRLGRAADAVGPAKRALAHFEALHCEEDAADMRGLLALIDLAHGRIDDAMAAVAGWRELPGRRTNLGSIWPRWVKCELQLRQGAIEAGLAGYLSVLTDADSWAPPQGGLTTSAPSVGALAAATTAHARYSSSPGAAGWLYDRSVATTAELLAESRLDFPLTGSLMYAAAAWRLLALADTSAVTLRLMALALRYGQSLGMPTWPVADAEQFVLQRWPELWMTITGEVAALAEKDLRAEATAVIASFGVVTSSAHRS